MRSRLKKLPFFLICSLWFLGCDAPVKKGNPNPWPELVTVDGNRFIDQRGREVLLNGINIVNKSKEDGYMFAGGADFYANLRKWGFNSIRFIVIWDGLEPEPGVYNEDYLNEIDQRLQWAGDNGLFVVLDMHQDLFSVKFSDGAPEWATLDEGKEHQTGAIWSDSYMLSEAVQTSFDNFWSNQPAPDGTGVQDHYAAAWRHLAERYKDNRTVIGYDLMNEPFPGSMALPATASLLNQYGKLVYMETGQVLSQQEVAAAWADEESRMEALKILSSQEAYAYVMDTLSTLNREFEINYLQPMYQKVANAIREVDTKSILFLEHSYYSNTGVTSGIERVTLQNGKPDPLVAYSPHAYDLVTDTKSAASSASERLDLIFTRIKEKGEQLDAPVWLGEWGAYYNHSGGIVNVAQHAISLIDQYQMSHAYWSYFNGLEDMEYFQQALLRPYPVYTNGTLINYGYDFESSVFEVSWKEAVSKSSPTVIYIPWVSKLDGEALVELEGAYLEETTSDSGWLIVPGNGEGQNRELTLRFIH